jgi:hypothetical protein
MPQEPVNALLPTIIEFDQTVDFEIAVRRSHFSRGIRRLCIELLPVGVIGVFGVLDEFYKGRSTWDFWLLICFSIAPFLWWAIFWWATAQIRLNTVPPHINVYIEPDFFSVRKANNTFKIEWSRVRTIWKFQDLIMLFWDKRNLLENSLAIPSQTLSGELLQFIEKKVRDNGGKVV